MVEHRGRVEGEKREKGRLLVEIDIEIGVGVGVGCGDKIMIRVES